MRIASIPLVWLAASILLVGNGTQAVQADEDGPNERARKKFEKTYRNWWDVPYLPNRQVGVGPFDRLTTLNVHRPQDAEQRLPLIILVHGGGYGGGDKEKGEFYNTAEAALERGFAVANLNYILGKGLFPQVYWDYDAAVRHLRAGADQYGIDPDRIGAWGFSAGGWLSGSAGLTDADDIHIPRNHVFPGELARSEEGRAELQRLLTRRGQQHVQLPMDNPHLRYPKYSARLTAIQADFWHGLDALSPDDPDVATYIGRGGARNIEEAAQPHGLAAHSIVVPGEKFAGDAKVHVPNLETEMPDGRPLREHVLDWFEERLVEDAKIAAPEFRPNIRRFSDSIEVTAVTSSPDVTVHYTTDGSAPSNASPVLDRSLKLTETTQIKAIAVKHGFRPSGVTTANFVRGDRPPRISGPEELPTAVVGKPYEVGLSAAADDAEAPIVWRWQPHFRLENHIRDKRSFTEVTGLELDPQRGVIQGVPKTGGAFTIQTQAATSPTGPADARTYVLVVDAAGPSR